MLSVPHMIVVFVIVLVVFGPQKLPELARSLGKLMAEFRKASSDFRGAFEEEMRDLERQAREVERKKVADAAAVSAASSEEPATFATPAGAETASAVPASQPPLDSRETEALVATPIPESIPRSFDTPGDIDGAAASVEAEAAKNLNGDVAKSQTGEAGPPVTHTGTLELNSEDRTEDAPHDQQHA